MSYVFELFALIFCLVILPLMLLILVWLDVRQTHVTHCLACFVLASQSDDIIFVVCLCRMSYLSRFWRVHLYVINISNIFLKTKKESSLPLSQLFIRCPSFL